MNQQMNQQMNQICCIYAFIAAGGVPGKGVAEKRLWGLAFGKAFGEWERYLGEAFRPMGRRAGKSQIVSSRPRRQTRGTGRFDLPSRPAIGQNALPKCHAQRENACPNANPQWQFSLTALPGVLRGGETKSLPLKIPCTNVNTLGNLQISAQHMYNR